MTCFELIAALEITGLMQRNLAALCGVSEETVSRWATGSKPIPRYVETIVALLLDTPDADRGALAKIKVEPRHVFRKGATYRSLVKKFHPDKSRRNTNKEMQQINAARDALKK